MAFLQPPKDDKQEINEFLRDIASRKEFSSLADFSNETKAVTGAYIFTPLLKMATNVAQLTGLQLHGAQLFVSNFHNPNTPFKRLLINWRTGAGKSIAMLAITMNYINEVFKKSPLPLEQRPWVYVIGLTKNIIRRELLRNPDFGFVTLREVEEHSRLRTLAESGIASDVKAYNMYSHILNRRLSNKARGGYFKFYGYQEFANRVFIKSKDTDFDIVKLYARTQAHQEDFLEKIQEEIKKKNIIVNQEVIDGIRHGLLVADEIHDTYNIASENNYGIAIQYVLDALGKDEPRTIYMSATFASGSAAEAVDLLNFLIPGGSESRGWNPRGFHQPRSSFQARR